MAKKKAAAKKSAAKKKTRKAGAKKAPERKAPPAGRPSALVDTRVVYCGDCLEKLADLPDRCVDLIYIDPPFNSNRNYEVFWGETKEKRAFEDRHASTQAYIDYMRPRCVELKRVLKDTGSFYYHCDWHASHYVKVMLDQAFGENSFQNEIVWRRSGAHSDTKQGMKRFGVVSDSIFFYTGGSQQWTFNPEYQPYDETYVESMYRHVEEGTGRRYRLDNLTASKPGGDTSYDWPTPDGRSVRPYKGRYWAYSRKKMEAFERDGRIVYSRSGMPNFKRYLDEMPGVSLQNVWVDMPALASRSKERLGYPTQKPIALLERIIKASSNPNDIVLDAFCGCGTALVAAQNLGRQWIGIDVSPTACRVMGKRLRDVCKMKESEPNWLAHSTDAFIVRDLPWTIEKLHKIPPFEFENWAVIALGGVPNTVQVGDMGIDGRIFPVGSRPDDQHSMFAGDWFPVQVKQKDKAGRPDIDQFEAVMEREDRQRGFFVAFGYTSDAEHEAAAFHKRTGRWIKLIAVQEILDEQFVQKM
ncbi:MAG: restriction endonuclease [Phycisphaeraceae bacterium]|nr:MAG: restriction endonuclease [Phycisphaeraceae bacterium]